MVRKKDMKMQHINEFQQQEKNMCYKLHIKGLKMAHTEVEIKWLLGLCQKSFYEIKFTKTVKISVENVLPVLEMRLSQKDPLFKSK